MEKFLLVLYLKHVCVLAYALCSFHFQRYMNEMFYLKNANKFKLKKIRRNKKRLTKKNET